MRDGGPDHGHGDHVLLGDVDALADGVRYFARLAQPCADAALAVTDDDERAEREAAPALDHFRDAVERDDLLLEFAAAIIAAIHAHTHLELQPSSRAASARALTRPWKRKPARSNTTVSTPAALARSEIVLPIAELRPSCTRWRHRGLARSAARWSTRRRASGRWRRRRAAHRCAGGCGTPRAVGARPSRRRACARGGGAERGRRFDRAS